MNASERALTVKEVAARMSLSERTIRKLIAEGTLPCRRIGGAVRVLESVLDAFLLGEGEETDQ